MITYSLLYYSSNLCWQQCRVKLTASEEGGNDQLGPLCFPVPNHFQLYAEPSSLAVPEGHVPCLLIMMDIYPKL